jgi:hypothetical protein
VNVHITALRNVTLRSLVEGDRLLGKLAAIMSKVYVCNDIIIKIENSGRTW